MEREARVDRGGGMHVTDRVDCLVKAISACHKCDLDSTQVRVCDVFVLACFIVIRMQPAAHGCVCR